MRQEIRIGERTIGAGSPVFVIAEAGVNHNGSVDSARELIRAAHAAGADCVKFQTFRAESAVTASAPKAEYQVEVTGSGSQLEMLKALELPEEAWPELIDLCRDLGIAFMSTPYNFADVDLLDGLGVPAFKLASIHLVELPFVRYVAARGRPVILSTGMATLAEARDAVAAAREEGNEQVVVLQCTTNYPASLEDANVRAMVTLGRELSVHVGFSDHCASDLASLAAVALGASVIEKHFTLDRTLPGPDHSSSLDPAGLRRLVESIRGVERALGSGVKSPAASEARNTSGMRRSIVAVRPIRAGERIRREALDFKRPATGLEPRRLDEVVGRLARRDIPPDTPLVEDAVIWE